jgi:eukaryotic-like serine/threonine-protein kinase
MTARMSPERWRQVTGIFHAARLRPPEQRASLLADQCGIDADLRRQVDAMLAADAAASGFGEVPLAGSFDPHEPALAPGTRVGAYEITAALGAGGMGEVYRAHDPRLGRNVAIKILPRGFAAVAERLMRFRREARVLASLNHPHIAAIYDVETTGAIDHLILELVEGETLAERIARARAASESPASLPSDGGPRTHRSVRKSVPPRRRLAWALPGSRQHQPGGVPLVEVLTIARQIAQALGAAHDKGIVHRDLKPANVKLTPDGRVKVLDFGLARDGWSLDERACTYDPDQATPCHSAAGLIVGSPAYMSPEQARGDPVDARTDVWAFGCLLYELLAGRQAFAGESVSEPIAGVQDGEPDWMALPHSTPRRIRVLVRRCLEKEANRRLPAIGEAETTLAQVLHDRGRWRMAGAAAAGLLVVAVSAGLVDERRAARVQWARNVAVPRIMELVASGEYTEAFGLAVEVERRVPADPLLATLWPQFSAPISLTTMPEGADVYVRGYTADDEEWRLLGRTPLEGLRLPLGVFQVRIEKVGYESQLIAAPNPSTLLGNATSRLAAAVEIRLLPRGAAPGMVAVPGGTFPVSLNAFSNTRPIPLDPYMIDRYEITNAQYQQFVDAGAYARAEYWEDLLFERDGRQTSWREAVATFRDATGAPGPATWQFGRRPAGTGEHPVGGVSWYEAVAYCRFRGQTLPTLYHWRRAALSPDEMFAPLAPALLRHSNVAGGGPARVGTFRGVGPYGTYDMAGNVREWSWNEARPGHRWIQGGAWSEPDYMLVVPDNAPALDRSPINGFRCARYGAEPLPDDLLAPVERSGRDNRAARAVSDEVFAFFRTQLRPIDAPLNARVDSTDTTHAAWVKQKISFDIGYEDGLMAAYVFLPTGVKPPYQAVVYFPGRSSFIGRMPSDALQPDVLDFVVNSGRALVWPIYKGSYERWIPTAMPSAEARRILFDWRQDLSRVIDVLSQRADIDPGRIAFLGLSYGATAPMPLLALEERFQAAVLLSAGFNVLPGSPQSDPLNYAPRITLPVLLLSGRQDFVFPLETSAIPLFERLGSPASHKRHVVFDAGHMMFPRGPMVEEVLGWFDRFLGLVGGG